MQDEILEPPDGSSNAVDLSQLADEWVVNVTEAGIRSSRSFKLESAARSFSDGQRARLGLGSLCSEIRPGL